MKRTKVKPEEKPITAQPPQDAAPFDTLVPVHADKDGVTTSHRTTSGCYRTPRRRGAP